MNRLDKRFEINDSKGMRLLVHLTQLLINIIAWPLFLILYDFRIYGRKNLSSLKHGIVVANHCQFIDAYYIGLAAWPRLTWYAVESNNILRKDVGWWNRITGAFGIREKFPMSIASSIPKAKNMNSFVAIFPEGKLSHRNQEVQVFSKGAFYLALQNEMPLIPVAQVLQERWIHKFFHHSFPKVRLHILPAIDTKSYGEEGMSLKEKATIMSREVEQMIQDCIDENRGCRSLKTEPLFQ